MSTGNPILDKNLECIAKYNPQLSDKLLNLPYLTNSIELIETDLKEPNLSYNGLALHDSHAAEAEVQELFKKAETEGACINVVFGMGLGYLFKEFSEHTIGSVLLFEPNLDILRVTLELVDFSKELAQKNVRVASDFHELKSAFEALYSYKAGVNFLYLNSYAQFCSQEIKSAIKQVEILKGTCVEQFNLIGEKGLDFALSVINNLASTLDAIPLMELRDLYKGKTAIIISAGPTLDLNIELIKKYRDKFVIFCVGTAFKVLATNGITPDFLNVIEMFDCSGQVKGFDLSNINLILEPFTNESFQSLNVKQKFLFPSSLANGSQYWAHLVGFDISPYSSAGCVSFEALASAKMLGFSKIILVGQDLAHVNNRCYSSMGSYSDLVFEIDKETNKLEFRLANKENFLDSCSSVASGFTKQQVEKFAEDKLKSYQDTSCLVKGISGEMVPTLSAYALFVDLFREFAHLNKDLDLINTSMIGAQIDGFKNQPLADALENVACAPQISLPSGFKFDKAKVLENLENEAVFLKGILNDFLAPKECLFKLEREFKRATVLTKEANKYLSLLLQAYDALTVKYFEKNNLYRTISMIESLKLKQYAESHEEDSCIRIKKLYEFLKIYFVNVEEKLQRLISAIDDQKVLLKASISL